MLKDTGSSASLNYCYRPSQFTARLLKKLELIHRGEITRGSELETRVARELHAGNPVLAQTQPDLLSHNLDLTTGLRNPLTETFNLLSGLLTPRPHAPAPFGLPFTSSCFRPTEGLQLAIFPIPTSADANKLERVAQPKTTPRANIWELFNEKMSLEGELSKESAKELTKLRLWEDSESLAVESPHLLLLPSVTSAWQREYQEQNRSLLYSPAANLGEEEFIQKTLLLLQGVPSDFFSFSVEEFAFRTELDDSCTIQGSPFALYGDVINEFCAVATMYVRLKEIFAYLSKTTAEGLIVQAFAIAANDYLQAFQESLLNIFATVKARREIENQMWKRARPIHAHPTVLELYTFVLADINQLKILSTLCGCAFYDVELLKPEQRRTASFSKQNYRSLEDGIRAHVRRNWVDRMRKGADLLTHIYSVLNSDEYDFRYADFLRTLFSRSAGPLFDFVNRAIHNV